MYLVFAMCSGHLLQFQFVCITFWGIYAIDREYIYPAEVDEFIPQLLNHFWVRKQLYVSILCIDELHCNNKSLLLTMYGHLSCIII